MTHTFEELMKEYETLTTELGEDRVEWTSVNSDLFSIDERINALTMKQARLPSKTKDTLSQEEFVELQRAKDKRRHTRERLSEIRSAIIRKEAKQEILYAKLRCVSKGLPNDVA